MFLQAASMKSLRSLKFHIPVVTGMMVLAQCILAPPAAATPGNDHVSRAQVLASSGKAALESDNGNAAFNDYEECRKLLDQPELAPNLLLAECIDGLGRASKVLAHFKDAMPYYQRALAMREQLDGADSASVAASLNNIAMLHLEAGNHGEGRPLLERTVAIYRKIEGETALNTALARLNLGQIRRAVGDYQGALQDFQETLHILQIHHPDQQKAITLAMLRLAGVQIALGNLEPAYGIYQARLAILRRMGPGSRTDVGTTLANMAEIERRMGRHTAAIDLLRQAMEHHDQVAPEDKLNFAALHYNMGNNLRSLRQYEPAIEEFRKAIAVREQMQGKWHARLSILWRALGIVEFEKGDSEKALAAIQKGAAIALANDLPEPQADMYEALAKVMYREHPAVSSYLGKISVNRYQHLIANVAGSGKGLHRGYVADNVKVFRTLAEILLKQSRIDEAQQVIASLRAWEYAEFTNTATAATPVPLLPNEMEWDVQLQNPTNQLRTANLARQKASEQFEKSKSTKDARALAEAETQLDLAEATWRAQFEHILVQAKNVPLATAATAVATDSLPPSNTAYLQYFFGPTTGFGIVSTRADKHVFELAESRSALAKRVTDFRQLIAQRRLDPTPMAEELHRTLIAPVLNALGNTTTLLIAPDEELRYLPFAALRHQGHYLVEQFELGIGNGKASAAPGRQTWKLALFGNSEQQPDYPALPNVPQELRGIASIKAKQLTSEQFLNQKFNRANLNQSLSGGYNAVHLATHFVFRPGGENDSFLLLGDGSKMTLKDWRNSTADFRQVDLITLSACETAVDSKNAFGAEIDGLGTLLRAKGARSVVATLWPVDDTGTSRFMPKFYAALAQGKSKAEALRMAQVAFVKQGSSQRTHALRGAIRTDETPMTTDHNHPYYWAPFILLGDWR
jgi:CHAT domain-containing protein